MHLDSPNWTPTLYGWRYCVSSDSWGSLAPDHEYEYISGYAAIVSPKPIYPEWIKDLYPEACARFEIISSDISMIIDHR